MTPRALKILAKLTTAFAIAFFAASPAALALAPVGKAAPAFSSVKDINGSTFSAADLNDSHTLIVFFSIYIDGAAEMLKSLDAMSKLPAFFGNLNFIAVNVDPSRDTAAAFLKEKNIRARVIADNNLELAGKFSVKKPPAAFLVGPDRIIKFSSNTPGADNKFNIEAKLPALLKRAASGPDSEWLDREFKEKKLVAASATFTKICPSDGNLMLYVSSDGILWMYNIGTGARKNLAADAATADWSPGCGSVTYDRKKKGDVWIKELDEPAEMIAQTGRAPVWSPDGDMVAYLSGDSVWVYQISEQKRWQTAAVATGAQWALDGALLLATDAKGRAWLVSPQSKASLLQKIFR